MSWYTLAVGLGIEWLLDLPDGTTDKSNMPTSGPSGVPRPLASPDLEIAFEMRGRVEDVDEDNLESVLDMSVRVEQGIRPGTIDVIVMTNQSLIENEEFTDIRGTVTTRLSTTHSLVGWRIGEI